MEAGLERHPAAVHARGEVCDFVGDRVPLAVVFLGRGFGRRLDHMSRLVRWREVDHLEVVVQRRQDGFARDVRRERRDGGEDGSRHGN